MGSWEWVAAKRGAAFLLGGTAAPHCTHPPISTSRQAHQHRQLSGEPVSSTRALARQHSCVSILALLRTQATSALPRTTWHSWRGGSGSSRTCEATNFGLRAKAMRVRAAHERVAGSWEGWGLGVASIVGCGREAVTFQHLARRISHVRARPCAQPYCTLNHYHPTITPTHPNYTPPATPLQDTTSPA